MGWIVSEQRERMEKWLVHHQGALSSSNNDGTKCVNVVWRWLEGKCDTLPPHGAGLVAEGTNRNS